MAWKSGEPRVCSMVVPRAPRMRTAASSRVSGKRWRGGWTGAPSGSVARSATELRRFHFATVFWLMPSAWRGSSLDGRLRGCGAAVKNLAHSASFDSREKTAPSKPGFNSDGATPIFTAGLGCGIPVLGVLPALARDPLRCSRGARTLGDRLKVVLGEGLATSEGELWPCQRRILQPALRQSAFAASSRSWARRRSCHRAIRVDADGPFRPRPCGSYGALAQCGERPGHLVSCTPAQLGGGGGGAGGGERVEGRGGEGGGGGGGGGGEGRGGAEGGGGGGGREWRMMEGRASGKARLSERYTFQAPGAKCA